MDGNSSGICEETFATISAVDEEGGMDGTGESHVFFNVGLIGGFLVIFFIGICGNTMVMYLSLAPTISKSMNTMNTYIFHLGLADALYVFASLFFTVTNFNKEGWLFGNIGCKIIPAIDIVTMNVSAYVLGIMSLERYLALVKPMFINRYRSWFYARSLCVIVWLSGIILTIPCMASMELTNIQGYEIESCMWSYGIESYRNFLRIVFSLTFVIPSVFMVTIYCLVGFHFMRIIPKGQCNPRVSRSKRGIILIVLLIVGVYWLCFTPFWTYQMLLIHDDCGTFDRRNVMGLTTLILSYLNSCVNPFLYTLLPRKYNIWRKSRRERSRNRTESIRLRVYD